MKKALKFRVWFYNQTLGRLFKKKKILVVDQVIKISTKSDLNLKAIKRDFPNGVPKDHPLSGYA